MDKLQLIVNNGVSDNIKKIASLFPNCVTETTDAEGQSKFAVDFDKLRQELEKGHTSCQFSYNGNLTPRP